MAGYITKGGNKTSNRAGSVVSRRLRQADFNVSPSARRGYDGIFVRQLGDSISVYISLGVQTRNEEAANEMVKVVAGWAEVAGLRADQTEDGSIYLRFTYGL